MISVSATFACVTQVDGCPVAMTCLLLNILCHNLRCGTGLMGPLLRAHVDLLEGVDLSSGMIEKAKERGCYDKLEVGSM